MKDKFSNKLKNDLLKHHLKSNLLNLFFLSYS